MALKKINWGIIGLGHIANKFAQDLLLTNDAVLYAVASRDLSKAKSYHIKYQSRKYYGSYEELVKDPEIDIVYIATPHVFHFEHTILCLQNNKAVLCEKPFAMNYDEVNLMIDTAKKNKLFLMEAMWMRFIPGIKKVIETINSGIIGEIKSIEANFGYKAEMKPEGRLFNRMLGGGSLMDIGIYPVYLSLMLLGDPLKIDANANILNEVDYSCDIRFSYQNGQVAILKSTLNKDTSTEAIIYGEKGKIKIHKRFHHPNKITVSDSSDYAYIININYKGNGYYHEIVEVNSCMQRELKYSNRIPHSKSIELIQTLDKIRKIIGLSYPNDSKFH